MIRRALGLDLSLTRTGVAGPGWTDTITPPAAMRGPERLLWLQRHITDYIRSATLVAVEGPSYGNQGSSRQPGHHERAGLWWIVRCTLHTLDIPVAVVPPATLKRYATGRGNASKADMVLAAARRFPWFDGGEDEADALWLAAVGADHLGQPLVDMPATHRAALAGVEWPALTTDDAA